LPAGTRPKLYSWSMLSLAWLCCAVSDVLHNGYMF
jgi:hypothetical protein